MTKAEILEEATSYYLVLIVHYFLRSSKTSLTLENFKNFVDTDSDYQQSQDVYEFEINDSLFEKAVIKAQNEGLVEFLVDKYGPPLITRIPDTDIAISEKLTSKDPSNNLYRKYYHGRGQWLFSALAGLHRQIDMYFKEDDDFIHDNWEPIQVEDNQETRDLLEKIDECREAVRTDNGYAANHPHERKSVLFEIDATRQEFEEKTTTIQRIKGAFSALGQIIKRFGSSTTGLAAQAALSALKKWIETRGIAILDELFKFLP